MRIGRCLAVLFGIVSLFTFYANAQEYRGTIYGQVTDQTGAAIPGAKITAKGPQQTYTAIARSNGDFTIPFVELGIYSVSVEASNFGTETQDGIHIDVAAKVNLNFHLKVGSTAETVTVDANSAALNTADASGGTTMDPEKVQNLPLNGRQVYQLLTLTPGVKQNTSGFSGTRGWDETNQIYINGQSGNYNQFTLNGAPVSQQGGGGAGTWNIAPSVDAVEEFKVMTNTYDAAYGREAGGTVNTVLKSGTNEFHGTLYDFWRNSILDANTYVNGQQGEKKDPHNEHQFGGTVGGPVWKNRTYFFFNYEGYRQVQPKSTTTTTLPADILNQLSAGGDVNFTNYLSAFSETGIYDPNTTPDVCQDYNSCQVDPRQQFANNTIPAARISAIGKRIAQLYPTPNLPGYFNNFYMRNSARHTYNMPIARVDQVFTNKTRMYGTFAWWAGHENDNESGLPYPIAQGDINNYRSSLTQILDLTHTFTPNLLSDVRLSFNRAYNVSPSGAVGAGLASSDFTAQNAMGLNMPAIPTTTHAYPPEIDIYNCCTANIIGNTVSPSLYETYALSPSLIWTLKSHTLHFGADFNLYHDVPTSIGQPNGNFIFNSSFTQKNPYQGNADGDAIAEMLLGIPEGGAVQWWDSVYESYNYYAAYVQDDWKVRHNLTLNLGLRWETESSPRDRNNRLTAGFCDTCVNPINQIADTSIFAQNPVLGGYQFASGSFSAYQNYFGTLEPKFGLSLALTPHLVMRGGYGLGTALGIELGSQSSWEQNTNFVTSLDGGRTPSGYFNTGTPYPNGAIDPPGNSQGLLTEVGNGVTFDQRNRKIPRVQQYSFGFQGEAPAGIIWDLEYVGSYTTRLRAGKYLNSISPTLWNEAHENPALLQNRVSNPFYCQDSTQSGTAACPVGAASDLGSAPTISLAAVNSPYPEFSYVYNYADPTGYTIYNSMVAKAEKRLSSSGALVKGLSFLTSFTWSKTETATGRLNNNSGGLVDATPAKVIDSNDRVWDLSFSGLYGLPIGKGGLIASNAHGVLDKAISDWQLEWIFQNDGGTPVGIFNTYNYTCSGSYDLQPQHRTWSNWLNNSSPQCFSPFAPYTTITTGSRTSLVRNPWAQQTTIGLEKNWALYEGVKLQFKAEAFNVTNTPIFGLNSGNPNQAIQRVQSVADPNQPGAWTGFGTVNSSTYNQPRQIQFGAKILF